MALLGLLGLLTVLLAGCGPGSGTATAPGASISPSSGSSASSNAAGPHTSGSGSNGTGVATAGCPAPSSNAPGSSESHLQVRSLCALPPQAAQVWRTIQSGGRLTYSRDGIVFNNAERLLPQRTRGYYHEYTVPTPGSPDRGARRLITGQSHEVYYTGDHYASFVVVDTAAVGSG
ncbi:MAG TPA: ribonuclease domain-containing protein [Pseudonocardia sp.]|nr:ribonuclease domain-containing protein [Pseudonocardia sp.]